VLRFVLKIDNLSTEKSIHYICIMGTLKRFFDFYILSNIHVALAAFCLTKITLIENEIENNLLPFFVLFSTIVSYNLIRFYNALENKIWFAVFIKKNKKILLGLTFLSLGILIYQSFFLNLKAIITLIPFGFLTLFYVIPFPWNKSNSFTLRSVAFLKLFLIAISYAGITVLFPLINYSIEVESNEIITFIQRFLFIVSITIPFDIRDLNFDNKNLKTLPQVIGIQKSKVVGLLFLMLFLGLEILKNSTEANYRINFIIALISLFFLLKATHDQNKYYSAFFVESIPMIWLLLLVFIK
jgi:hypothetical protein